MQPLTNQQRDTAYEAATKQQLYLYEDPSSGAKLKAIAGTQNIVDKKAYSAFAIAVGDVILGLVPQEKLPDLLIERLQITRPEAMKVTADVLDFLAPLGNTGLEIASKNSISDNEVLEVELAQAEMALDSSVQPIRTMAHDMETARQPKEETHSAPSQSELLSGNQTEESDTRWGTT